jgi:EAL and modified HD-GYP domain-containing signal transduction protein
VNATRDALIMDWLQLLPPASTVVEVIESVEPDAQVVDACRRLKGLGYRIALDDFRPGSWDNPLLRLADIVKVDVLATGQAERAAIAKRLLRTHVALLAEKVETLDIVDETRAQGYSLFQGFFFARPVVVTGRDIAASKRSYLRVLHEIHREDIDLPALADIIERELALSYKLLRYINASFYGWRGSVSSIRHALMLLGAREIRRWATVIALAGMVGEESDELIHQALLRGRLCELLAPAIGLKSRASDLFFMGLFSLIDVLLEQPMGEILNETPIAEDAKAALLGEPGPMRSVLDLVCAYLSGQWSESETLSDRLSVLHARLPALFASALEWCDAGDLRSGLDRAA